MKVNIKATKEEWSLLMSDAFQYVSKSGYNQIIEK